MSLSCGCGFDPLDCDTWWWEFNLTDDGFTSYPFRRGRACESCGLPLHHGDMCVEVPRYRWPKPGVEEKIMGEGNPVSISSLFFCEECGEIFLNLLAYGYCLSVEEPMQDQLREHWEIAGYTPVHARQPQPGGEDA